MSVGHELLNVPFPEMVYNLASAIAEAQVALDQRSIDIMKIMGNEKEAPVYLPSMELDSNLNMTESTSCTSMIGAGFQPTFYQFAETIIEVKMAITVSNESNYERTIKDGKRTTLGISRGRLSITTSPINASYSSKYNYSQEGTSLLRTRLVPMPPNNIIQRQLDLKAQIAQSKFEVALAKIEAQAQIEMAKAQAEVEAIKNETEQR